MHPFLTNPPATAQTNIKPATDPGLRPISRQALPRFFATNLDIDVTEACNLACVYCFKSELYGQYMTLNTMKRTLDWLVAASGDAESINCNFMGGEPTLRWEAIRQFVPWARMRGRAVGKRVTFSMTSNMTLWNEEMCNFVDEYGFGLLMSIDGCPEVQDAQRPARNGKPVSATVAHWAQRMLQTRPRSTARATLHPTFVSKFFDSVVYLHSLGFRELTFAASDYGAWTEEHFSTLDAQYKMIEEYIYHQFVAGKPIGLTVLSYLINSLVRHQKMGREMPVQKAPCGAGKGYLMVDYVGDIWPCHRFDGADTDAKRNGDFRLGNIFVSGFHQELQDTFLQFDHSVDHKVSCATCPVNPVCAGYCPAANLSDTGSIYTPHDNYCRWSNICHASASRLYDRFAADPVLLDALIKHVAGTHSDGR